LDCLLLHVPKFRHGYGPYGKATFINFMASGLLSLATAVRRAGYQVRVVHVGLERLLSPDFRLEPMLQRERPSVVGVSVHWHHQVPDSLDVVRSVRRELPDAFVVLGGLTASAYAEEILLTCPEVDGVVCGEGEIPLVRLLEARGAGRSPQGVPNLSYRDGGRVVRPSTWWHATDDEFQALEFADFSLLENAAAYPRLYPFMLPPERVRLNRLLFEMKRTAGFHVPLGRGCFRRCAWCGGGADATVGLLRRERSALTSPEAAVATLERALAFGYRTVATDHWFHGMEGFLSDVLTLCRKRGLAPRWNLDAWELPSLEFCEEFAATAGAGSTIEFSPDMGSQRLRERYKAFRFGNDELLAWIDAVGARGLNVGLHFLYGLPSGPEDDLEEKRLLERLERRSNVCRIQFHACEIEPMSPMLLRPEEHGIEPLVKSFSDYARAHRGGFRMGFSHSGLSEAELHAGRCRSYCLLGRNGRMKCRMLRLATGFRALDPLVHAAGRLIWRGGGDRALLDSLSPGAR